MDESLQNVPCKERPRKIAALPGGWIYFRTWRSLRWFLVLSVPPIASSVFVWMNGHGFWQAFGCWILCFALSISLFVSLSSGMSSSNLGTYFRKTEPVRYWVEITVMSVVYCALCSVGYLWRWVGLTHMSRPESMGNKNFLGPEFLLPLSAV